MCVRPDTPAWSNTYTRLLLRKKNRNYRLFKKASCKLANALTNPSCTDEYITILQNKKSKSHKNSRIAANESVKANQRVKDTFYNTMNLTMNNLKIYSKKKLAVLIDY